MSSQARRPRVHAPARRSASSHAREGSARWMPHRPPPPAAGRGRRCVSWLALAAVPAVTACSPPPAAPADGPTLALLVVVDQARADYLDRFAPLFKGGLKTLLEEGVVFTDAHHEHAVTATAPGHASIATGMEPRHSGIVGNYWYDPVRRRDVYAAGLPANPSPVLLEASTLGDWIKRRDPRSKVFAVSGKDRAAVLLGGRQPDAAYWYDRRTGRWRSSTYYPRAQRPWMAAFYAERPLDRFFAHPWSPLVGEQAWSRWGVVQVDRGAFPDPFPHLLGGLDAEPGRRFYESVYTSPFIDWYTVQFAERLIDQEALGSDAHVDLLAVSLSALDTVGHEYGPDSPEVLDVLTRLDLYLGELLEFATARVGRDRLVVALSADHGVAALPELTQAAGRGGRRLQADDVLCVQRLGARLDERFGDGDWFLDDYYVADGLYLDRRAITARGIDPLQVERAAAELLADCPAVQRAWTATELSGPEPPRVAPPPAERAILAGDAAAEAAAPALLWEHLARRFWNTYRAGRSPDLLVQMRPHYLYYRGTGTTHGSVYEYDAWVPMIFYGRGLEPARRDEHVATVDLAPTLARLIGVDPPGGLDGVDRSALLGRASRP